MSSESQPESRAMEFMVLWGQLLMFIIGALVAAAAVLVGINGLLVGVAWVWTRSIEFGQSLSPTEEAILTAGFIVGLTGVAAAYEVFIEDDGD